jgi:hypothetical protein
MLHSGIEEIVGFKIGNNCHGQVGVPARPPVERVADIQISGVEGIGERASLGDDTAGIRVGNSGCIILVDVELVTAIRLRDQY